METCKDCFHYDVCKTEDEILCAGTKVKDLISDNFKCFKDKSRFIELPCKLGDELYCVYSPPRPANPADKGKWYMNKFEVARFHYGVKGLSIEMYGYGTVSVNEIGKTVFFTKEEAEKALKENADNV